MGPNEIALRRAATADLDAAESIARTAEDAHRGMTEEERTSFDGHLENQKGNLARADKLARLDAARSQMKVYDADAAPVAGRVLTLRSSVQEFVNSDQVESARSRGWKGGALLDVQGLSLRALIDNSVSSGGALQNPMRPALPYLAAADRRLRLVDLLPHGTTGDNSIEYVQDNTSDAAGLTAAEVAEGAVKPETTNTLTVVTDPIRTVAAWFDVTRQTLDDNRQLATYLEQRLMYKLAYRIETAILNGNGTSPNLSGLLNRSGIVTYAPATAEARIVTVRKAITLGQVKEIDYSVIVVNPADKETYDLSVTAGSGEFRAPYSPSAGGAPAYMWGLTPVVSNSIPAGTAMLIDPQQVMVWDRQSPTIYVTDSDSTKFTKNILTVLGEARVGLSVFSGAGIAKVTFNGAA